MTRNDIPLKTHNQIGDNEKLHAIPLTRPHHLEPSMSATGATQMTIQINIPFKVFEHKESNKISHERIDDAMPVDSYHDEGPKDIIDPNSIKHSYTSKAGDSKLPRLLEDSNTITSHADINSH